MNQLQIFLPPPANWQDFQDLVIEIARIKYVESSVQEYGRQGQKQRGVDVYAQDLMDNHIGLQCKETKKPAITTAIIDAEIQKAKQFQAVRYRCCEARQISFEITTLRHKMFRKIFSLPFVLLTA